MQETGLYETASIQEQLSERTRLIALSHIHHVFGREMEIALIKNMIGPDILISLDASQSVGHTKVDVESLNVDFISFSAHKMFAANGVGVLWVKPEHQAQLIPWHVGGKSAASIDGEQFLCRHDNLAHLFECGTLNIPGILSISPAINFIGSVGLKEIEAHVSALTHKLHQSLKGLPGIEFAPGMGTSSCAYGYGILAFRFAGAATGDLGFLLDAEDIFVRTGEHCRADQSAEDYIRVSMHVYNTEEEIERFTQVLAANVSE